MTTLETHSSDKACGVVLWCPNPGTVAIAVGIWATLALTMLTS